MRISEAKQIVGEMTDWQMVMQGIIDRSLIKNRVDLSKYSLEELLQANRLVDSNNKRKRSLQEHWKKKTGKASGISQQIICSDRLIAGVYVALNYHKKNEMLVLANDVGVAIVNAKYE